jgi:murein L,D-transpeptidase YcbB/YkuD
VSARAAAAAFAVFAAACANPAPRPFAATAAPQAAESNALTRAHGPEVALAIRDVVAAGQSRSHELPRPDAFDLAGLYEPSYAPRWVDQDGRVTKAAHEAMRLLRDASADGLNPDDYGARKLLSMGATLDAGPSSPALARAMFDTALSEAVLLYLRHLHLGRIDPRTLGWRLTVPAHEHHFVGLLRNALDENRFAETAAGLAPALAQYRDLRATLARYRLLASARGPEPVFRAEKPLRPGDAAPGLAALRDRLATLGDLEHDTHTSERYDGALVEAVKRFQTRHGLTADGIVGGATQAALRVPIPWRVRQLELALERLRWLPDLGQRRLVALNIPMFHLLVWDTTGGTAGFGMRAIVGRAVKTRTPVFVEEMSAVIFRPYWNVPRSILLNEIFPDLERDPGYLDRQAMEIVRGPGDDAQPVRATADTLALLRQGSLRLRQRPGPQNALGLVKFVFPNAENVYLHGTPARHLFARDRRDFSHGCVRVEDPLALAEWVLAENPGWTRDRIVAAMEGTRSERIDLIRPIQVVLFYLTAMVMPEDGAIHFADDIYGHDARMDRALRGNPAGE